MQQPALWQFAAKRNTILAARETSNRKMRNEDYGSTRSTEFISFAKLGFPMFGELGDGPADPDDM